ncbi:P-loop NTPase fold protein [Myroides sp.]|uniref:P-loop NTPase fold protein n=1 Tax=Myroides sp. TaxID=1874736 RepID=UPI0028AB4414|nr:P-loop NTPase fold protein [Myroides sp.]
MENKTITIDLSNSSNAKSFEKENVIHSKAWENVMKFISKIQEEYKENDDEGLTYKHNTITILGTRGSGKTSFLLSIQKELKKNKALLPLNIVDPTLVEEKGHVFLNVISSICDEVKEVFDKNDCTLDKDLKQERKDWKESLGKLAKGLPSIDGIGSSSMGDWSDAEHVMNKELSSIGAARKLAKNFSDFIKLSLKISEKEHFVLFFDDIDVDSTKGYAVLETIRKYFVTDQLITILSGDLKLYNTLIRDKKWSNFSDKLITYECSTSYRTEEESRVNMQKYTDLVTDLTSQYLVKIMQPKYRIHLKTLYDYYKTESEIFIKQVGEDELLSLKTFLEMVFKQFGINSPLQRATFIEFLLSQPLRTVVHFLAPFEHGNADRSDNANLVGVFLSDLYEKHVDVNILQDSSVYFIPTILDVLVREGKLKDSYQLIPTTLDNSFNAVLFSSSLLFSDHIDRGNRYLIFEYFYKIAYLRNFVQGEKEYVILNNIIKNSKLLSDSVFRDSSNQLQCSLYGEFINKKDVNDLGVIPLYGLAKRRKKGKEESEYRIDYVLSDQSILKQTLGYIPCFIGQFSYKQPSKVFYSIVSLFSTIGELMKRYEIGVLNETNFITTMIELSQVRYYSVDESNMNNDLFDAEYNNTHDLEDYIGYSELEFEWDNELDLFYKCMKDWFEKKQLEGVPSYILGKIFTRFYNSLKGIRHEGNSLGEIFELQIVAFFNAVIIEDVRENGLDSVSLNINNVSASTDLFEFNIKKIIGWGKNNPNEYEEKLALSKWFLSCPLLLAYVDEELLELISKFLGLDNESFLHEVDKYAVLAALKEVLPDGGKGYLNVNYDDSGVDFEKVYQLIKPHIQRDNFIRRYERVSYRVPTVEKFFEEFSIVNELSMLVGVLSISEEKELIKYCVDRFKEDRNNA